jgi:hypothetical protein
MRESLVVSVAALTMPERTFCVPPAVPGQACWALAVWLA